MPVWPPAAQPPSRPAGGGSPRALGPSCLARVRYAGLEEEAVTAEGGGLQAPRLSRKPRWSCGVVGPQASLSGGRVASCVLRHLGVSLRFRTTMSPRPSGLKDSQVQLAEAPTWLDAPAISLRTQSGFRSLAQLRRGRLSLCSAPSASLAGWASQGECLHSARAGLSPCGRPPSDPPLPRARDPQGAGASPRFARATTSPLPPCLAPWSAWH